MGGKAGREIFGDNRVGTQGLNPVRRLGQKVSIPSSVAWEPRNQAYVLPGGGWLSFLL